MSLTGDMFLLYNEAEESYKNLYFSRKIKASGKAANTKEIKERN